MRHHVSLAAYTRCAYARRERFEWDERARVNLRKRGIELADAVAVFDDPAAITIEDRDHGEARFVTLGADAFGPILVVVYAYRTPDTIRIISARKASGQERQSYED